METPEPGSQRQIADCCRYTNATYLQIVFYTEFGGMSIDVLMQYLERSLINADGRCKIYI